MIQQIILDGVYMPMVSGDRYTCYEEELSTTVEMTSGREVKELRNQGGRFKVWHAVVTYDWMNDATYRAARAILLSGKAIQAAVLPDNSDEMVASTFHVKSYTPATFAFDDGGQAVWRGLSFHLREVSPHA